MKDRWNRLIAALYELRDLVRHPHGQMIPVGGGTETSEADKPWETCRERLDEVLIPTEQHGRLLCHLENGKNYHAQGESGAALWEVVQAIRRSRLLSRLHS